MRAGRAMSRYAALDAAMSLFSVDTGLSDSDASALYLRSVANANWGAKLFAELRHAFADPSFSWTALLAAHDLGDPNAFKDEAAAKRYVRGLLVDPLTRLMKYEDVYVNREARFAIGRETYFGICYLCFPVRNTFAEYDEYYAVDEAQFQLYQHDLPAALAFADACREHRNDHLLIVPPGRLRGTAN